MKILFEVMYNKYGVLDWDHDYRFNCIYNLLKNLKNTHEIYYDVYHINKEDKYRIISLLNIFKYFDINTTNTEEIFFNVSICWMGLFTDNIEKYQIIKKISNKIIFYDHGPFKNSVYIDNIGWFPPLLPSYTDILNNICELNYDNNKCNNYLDNYLSKNYSKRNQSNIVDIQENIFNKYIFIPTQKHKDALFKNCKTNVFRFIEKIIKFGKRKKVPIVIKIHPHIGYLRDIQKIKINKIIKENEYYNIYFSEASINFLIKNARFTAILNGYLVMDNFINQSPVLMTLPNPFMFTDAIIYNEDLETGLNIIFDKKFDKKKMFLKQKKIVWWFLNNNTLFETNSMKKNIKILNNYLDNKL